MFKAKVTVEVEVEQEEIPADWQEGLKATFSTLDGVMVYFGGESRVVMKVKNIKVEESKGG